MGSDCYKVSLAGPTEPQETRPITTSAAPLMGEAQKALNSLFQPASATCSHIGDCGRAYQACCIAFGAKGYPCGCSLQDGNGTAGETCGDCGTAYSACCIGFAAKGYPCECK